MAELLVRAVHVVVLGMPVFFILIALLARPPFRPFERLRKGGAR